MKVINKFSVFVAISFTIFLQISSQRVEEDTYHYEISNDANDDQKGYLCRPFSEWRCGEGTCIAIQDRCDGTNRDCPDGSDESHCDEADLQIESRQVSSPTVTDYFAEVRTMKDNTAEYSVYLLEGSSAIINCANDTDEGQDVYWMDFNGRQVDSFSPNGWVKVDDEDNLVVLSAQIEHSGIYVCVIDGGEKSYEERNVKLFVYRMADVWLQNTFTKIFNRTQECSEEDTGIIEDMQSILCQNVSADDECDYVLSQSCVYDEYASKLVVQVSIYPSGNYRLPLKPGMPLFVSKFMYMEQMYNKIEENIQVYLFNKNQTYKSDMSFDRRVGLGCDVGFILHDDTCIPCLPGTFNDQLGSNTCERCLFGFHTIYAGLTECKPCEELEEDYGQCENINEMNHIVSVVYLISLVNIPLVFAYVYFQNCEKPLLVLTRSSELAKTVELCGDGNPHISRMTEIADQNSSNNTNMSSNLVSRKSRSASRSKDIKDSFAKCEKKHRRKSHSKSKSKLN